ncbi:hypothetical protein ACFQ08_44770, partial [Streptosporangium algeriense]
MRILARPHQLPVRLATGAFVLNAGLSMAAGDDDSAAAVHGMAANAYPFLKRMDPRTFAQGLSNAEIAAGAALLVPVVPSLVAG